MVVVVVGSVAVGAFRMVLAGCVCSVGVAAPVVDLHVSLRVVVRPRLQRHSCELRLRVHPAPP